MIRVIVIDENDSYREDFCKILQKHCFEVALSVKRNDKKINAVFTTQADLVIVDFKETKPDTLIVAKKIKECSPDIKLIFHTLHLPTYLASHIFKLGDGLIVKQYYDVAKGFHLIDQVLNNSNKVFGDKIVIVRRAFWILGRPYPEHQYLISDKAVQAIKENIEAVPSLMNFFSRGQPVIESWLTVKDVRLLSPGAIDCISKTCKLNVVDIMEEVHAGIFQVMV